MSDPLDIKVAIPGGDLTIEGRSRAGNETFFTIRQLGLALDIGRCPDSLVAVPHVFVTHPHLDHSLGIPFYIAQRRLQGLDPGHIYVPADTVDSYRDLLRVHERLQNAHYEVDLVGVAAGESVPLRRNLLVRAHRATHSVPAISWEVVEIRRKLRRQLMGHSEDEIRQIRLSGEEVADISESSLLFYSGDTDQRIFDESPALFESRILMLECTFTDPNDLERARRYTHIHLDDLEAVADRFRNEMIILTHFSLRESFKEVHRLVSDRCPEAIRARVRLALPEPWDRLT